MKTLQDMVQNSTLTRFLAILFLFIIVTGSAFIVGYEFFTGQTPNTVLCTILGVAIGSSIKILGISAGMFWSATGESK